MIYVVEDDRALREIVTTALRHADFEVKPIATDDPHVRHADLPDADSLVFGLRLPIGPGLELFDLFRRRMPELPVIIVSGDATIKVAVDAMRRGAADFLEKPFDVAALVARLRELIDRRRLRRAAEHTVAEIRQRLDALSARELEVLDLIVDGLSSREIARDLGIAEKTVFNHRFRIKQKTRASNATELARMVTQVRAATPDVFGTERALGAG